MPSGKCQQDTIGFIGGQLGVDGLNECRCGVARGRAPVTVDITRIAAVACELALKSPGRRDRDVRRDWRCRAKNRRRG